MQRHRHQKINMRQHITGCAYQPFREQRHEFGMVVKFKSKHMPLARLVIIQCRARLYKRRRFLEAFGAQHMRFHRQFEWMAAAMTHWFRDEPQALPTVAAQAMRRGHRCRAAHATRWKHDIQHRVHKRFGTNGKLFYNVAHDDIPSHGRYQ